MARTLVVNGYSEQWLRKDFPWVYPAEVVKGRAPVGSEVVLVSERGERLGVGLADEGFLAARVFRGSGSLDEPDWLEERLDRAAALREELLDESTTGYRLVHAENDDLPGVRIDWWHQFANVVLDSPALAPLLPRVLAWLARRQPRGVYLHYRPDRRDPRPVSSFLPVPGLVAGRPPVGPVRVLERGLRMDVDPAAGPDVGLYPDLRDLRAWLEPYWGGRSVLNLFAFTGAFSVAAARGGASEVVTVDLSARALERAEQNFRANDLDPGPFEFLAEDARKALDRFRRTGRAFDRIILDPPSFSHGEAGVFQADKDLPRLISQCARVMSPGGWLVVVSNQGEVSPRQFRGLVGEGLRKAGVRAQSLWTGSSSADVPAGEWFPEGRYLKVMVLRLLPAATSTP